MVSKRPLRDKTQHDWPLPLSVRPLLPRWAPANPNHHPPASSPLPPPSVTATLPLTERTLIAAAQYQFACHQPLLSSSYFFPHVITSTTLEGGFFGP